METQDSRLNWKIILPIIAVLLGLSFGLGYYWFFLKPVDDIRFITWGVSKAAIKSRERATLESERPDALIYRATILNTYPVAIGYDFENDALTSVKYVSLLKYQEFRECLAIFQQIQNLVFEQYGKPEITTGEDFREALWHNAITSGSLKILKTAEGQYIWVLTFQPA